MSAYEPGTVAIATVCGIPGVRVLFMSVTSGREMNQIVAAQTLGYVSVEDVTDVRRLVVLDPATSPEPLDAASACMLDAAAQIVEKKVKRPVREVPFLQWIADQIEAQTKPSRISEPGLYGVVEATLAASAYPRRWIRDGLHDDAQWVALETTMRREWDDLVDPVLVRDGVDGGAS